MSPAPPAGVKKVNRSANGGEQDNMQKVNLVCLILTGVCVVILIIGTGIGIASGKGDSEDDEDEYVQYDDDYVGVGAEPEVQVATGEVIDVAPVYQGSGV